MEVGRPLLPVHHEHVIAFAPPSAVEIVNTEVAADVVAAPSRLQHDIVAFAIEVGRAVHRVAMIGRELVFPAVGGAFAAKMRVTNSQSFKL